MSDLMGVWSVTGEPVSKRLRPQDRLTMLYQLPGYPRGLKSFEQGPGWLVAARANLSASPRFCVAIEGFVLGGLDAITRLKKAPCCGTGIPDGHYVLACAQPESGRLTLLRGLSGGERLYYTWVDDLVLFASSVRPLLAHARTTAALDRSKVGEVLLTGLTMSGSGTLFDGIQEVLPGHRLVFTRDTRELSWHWPGLLEPRHGEPVVLAREFRSTLGDGLSSALGQPDRVAVSLSGGIDSAAITALAVEGYGADKVHAFTYEFDDPQHGSETGYAVEVCKRLGIRHHHVLRISLPAFLNAIPETVWRAEHFVHWSKAWMLPLTRYIREHGFERYLTGFGVGSHMAYLADLARLIHRLPFVSLGLKYWPFARGRHRPWRERLEVLHPGLALPSYRQYFLLLRELKG